MAASAARLWPNTDIVINVFIDTISYAQKTMRQIISPGVRDGTGVYSGVGVGVGACGRACGCAALSMTVNVAITETVIVVMSPTESADDI